MMIEYAEKTADDILEVGGCVFTATPICCMLHAGVRYPVNVLPCPCQATHQTLPFIHVSCLQANIDRTADPAEWAWDKLAGKMVQYCTLLEGLTGEDLRRNANVSPLRIGIAMFWSA
jgi:hypothetical protein